MYVPDINIPGMRSPGPWGILVRASLNFLRHDMMTYASSLAYTILFALFPFMIFVVALVSFLELPGFFDWVLEQANLAFPTLAYEWLEAMIGQVREPQGGLLSVGAVLAVWAASAGFRSVTKALNAAYGVRETRPVWRVIPISLACTLGLALLLVTGAALALLSPSRFEWLARRASLNDLIVTLWGWLRLPVLAVILILVAAILYHVSPNVRQEFTILSPGAIVAVAIWLLGSQGFSLYIDRFTSFNATYGSLAGVIILLFFLFLSSAVLLFGGEINAEALRSRQARGEQPSDIPT